MRHLTTRTSARFFPTLLRSWFSFRPLFADPEEDPLPVSRARIIVVGRTPEGGNGTKESEATPKDNNILPP
ncbi:hypothetical protein JTE90_022730 [Oedothorax gibbosus]|uniref:Uncharacterized protein n=1 Tax=Oedothorax gibbosus TaxID=931172 RepID=A0AAV6UNW5_9ARAC|nr:hypothetical protein JTE90_022730 [Oedothorax gibbosus]